MEKNSLKFFNPDFCSSLKQIFLPGKQNSFVDPVQFIGDIDGIIGSNQILVIAYLAEWTALMMLSTPRIIMLCYSLPSVVPSTAFRLCTFPT